MSRTDHHNNRKPEWDRIDRIQRRLRRQISAARRIFRCGGEQS